MTNQGKFSRRQNALLRAVAKYLSSTGHPEVMENAQKHVAPGMDSREFIKKLRYLMHTCRNKHEVDLTKDFRKISDLEIRLLEEG